MHPFTKVCGILGLPGNAIEEASWQDQEPGLMLPLWCISCVAEFRFLSIVLLFMGSMQEVPEPPQAAKDNAQLVFTICF